MAYKISSDCVACGTCIDECPVGAIHEGEQYSIDPEVCIECGTCEGVCPCARAAQSASNEVYFLTKNVNF